jgi:hypothetical protein
MLEHPAGSDHLLELFRALEEVMDAVGLPGARRTGRGRDRPDEVRVGSQQGLADGRLPAPRWCGDNEENAPGSHVRSFLAFYGMQRMSAVCLGVNKGTISR